MREQRVQSCSFGTLQKSFVRGSLIDLELESSWLRSFIHDTPSIPHLYVRKIPEVKTRTVLREHYLNPWLRILCRTIYPPLVRYSNPLTALDHFSLTTVIFTEGSLFHKSVIEMMLLKNMLDGHCCDRLQSMVSTLDFWLAALPTSPQNSHV